MTAESARQFDALEAQAGRLMDVFTASGYERVAPAILQPADLFLDRVGEAIRGRTYVFTDPDGNELCLRPDLTIPVARIYLDRHPPADVEAFYCYNGPAFRYQYGAPDPLRPREFRQAGIESYGCADALKADIEVLCLTLRAVREAGLKRMSLKLGDNGLFDALLHALPLPERWRVRLAHRFSNAGAFARLLRQLSAPRGGTASASGTQHTGGAGVPGTLSTSNAPNGATAASASRQSHGTGDAAGTGAAATRAASAASGTPQAAGAVGAPGGAAGAPGSLPADAGASAASLDALLDALDPADTAGAERLVADHLDAAGIAFIGTRTLGEVAARLLSRAADRTEAPLAGEIVELIERYLAISGPAHEAADRIAALTSAAGLDISARLTGFRARLERMKALDCGGLDVTFSAKLGQRFEYYTGFVFELSVTDGGVPSPFASGGRYDKLLGGIGAAREVPAVGAAIYTERLLAAVAREAGE